VEEYEIVEWTEIKEVTDDEDNILETIEEYKFYETDNIPSDVVIPSDAVYRTKDEEGKTLKRKVLNPDYDPNLQYIPREDRTEWDTVGLMGKLRIRKGQPVGSRWIKMRDVSDIVEEWLVR